MKFFETKNEISTHLNCLRLLAEADGVVTDQEKNYIANLTSAYETRFPDFFPIDFNEIQATSYKEALKK